MITVFDILISVLMLTSFAGGYLAGIQGFANLAGFIAFFWFLTGLVALAILISIVNDCDLDRLTTIRRGSKSWNNRAWSFVSGLISVFSVGVAIYSGATVPGYLLAFGQIFYWCADWTLENGWKELSKKQSGDFDH